MKIRVLQVFGSLNRGGAETMIMNIYRKIDRTKVQFDFVVHTEIKGVYEQEIESLGGRIYRVPRFKGYNYFIYVKAWKKLLNNRESNSVVHCHIRSTASIIIKLARKYGFVTISQP